MVKNPPASAGDIRDAGSIPGSGQPLEEGTATHSSLLSWRIPWTEEPGRLQSIGSQRVGRDCKKRRGKKEPPLWTVGEGLYWAVALGQNSRGRVSKETKGVCEVRGVRRGFIARAGFPYKEESAGFSGV